MTAAARSIALRQRLALAPRPLADGAAVFVFEVEGAGEPALLAELERQLDADERAALDRQRPPQRPRMLLRRGLFRVVLGACLDVEPDRVPLFRGSDGRPRLKADAGARAASISATSRGDRCAFAVGWGCEVGIDIETADDGRPAAAIALAALHARERACHERLAGADRSRWLCSRWAAKEALLKGMGLGLSVDPAGLDLTDYANVGSAAPETLAVTGPDTWSLQAWWRGPAVVALASLGPQARLSTFRLRA